MGLGLPGAAIVLELIGIACLKRSHALTHRLPRSSATSSPTTRHSVCSAT
jgi:hypothetical protein